MGEVGQEDIEIIKKRLDRIDKKLDLFIAKSRYNMLISLSVGVMLAGLGLRAGGGSYVFEGGVLMIAGLTMLLLMPATRKDIYKTRRVAHVIAVFLVIAGLSLGYFGEDSNAARVALGAMVAPGALSMLVIAILVTRRSEKIQQ